MKINITITIDGNELVKFEKELDRAKTDAKRELSQYARFFDEACPAWTKNSEYNLSFLKLQQQYANDILKSKGHIFLNDVYDMLGMPRTKAGQVVGWVYNETNPVGDNYVDFGIFEEHNRKFVNGYETSILLDFNVDGCILEVLN